MPEAWNILNHLVNVAFLFAMGGYIRNFANKLLEKILLCLLQMNKWFLPPPVWLIITGYKKTNDNKVNLPNWKLEWLGQTW